MNKNEEIAKQLIKAASKDMTNAKEVAKALVEKGSDEEVEKVFEIFYNLFIERDEMDEILDERFGYDEDYWND